jgi:hypothetical protein
LIKVDQHLPYFSGFEERLLQDFGLETKRRQEGDHQSLPETCSKMASGQFPGENTV